MCCMLLDVARQHMGMFNILNPTRILLEDYTERKEPKLGLSSSVLTTVFSIRNPSCA